MTEQEPEKVKEYSNLNNYYLKISLDKQNLSLIGFNTENLDDILYQFNVTAEEIKQNNSKYKNLSLTELYDKIIVLIEKGKYLIIDNKNCISLSLFEGDNFDLNKDIQFLTSSGDLTKKPVQGNLSRSQKVNKTENITLPNPASNAKRQTLKEGIIQFHGQNINNFEQYIRDYKRKKTKGLNISALAKIDYESYPMVELSPKAFNIISGYGGNSYNGIARKYNEDRIKIITDYKLPKPVQKKTGETIDPKINYFAIYDGHGGEKCCNFLQENLHKYIFSSEFFPLYSVQAIGKAYVKAENAFCETVIETETGKLLDKSGSCAVSALIIDEFCFVINVGDSRALYSFDSGKQFIQVTRDHKPNDPIERERIEKAGGKIYKEDKVKINGKIVTIDEKQLPPGVKIPYRMIPGKIAVRK